MLIEPFTTKAGKLQVQCVGDKSLTHRAIIFAACAAGESSIISPCLGKDCRATLQVFRLLGVQVRATPEKLIIRSAGTQAYVSPTQVLQFQNSGTTARLLVGLLSGLAGKHYRCVGDESMSKRPMGRLVRLLREAGADIRGRENGEYLPLTIKGSNLQPRVFKVQTASAQLKSALLLAGMHAVAGEMHISMPAGSREHTEHMLRKAGIDCHSVVVGARQEITLVCPYRLPAQSYRIPRDPSAAAFLLASALLLPASVQVTIDAVCADVSRLAYLQVLAAMGGEIAIQKKPSDAYVTPICQLRAFGGKRLRGTTVHNCTSLLDEVVILAVLAMFAEGESRFCHLGELRHKESDRLLQIYTLIKLAGGSVSIESDDTLVVAGGCEWARAFTYDPVGDHRLAMAASVCALRATAPCQLKNHACVAISFPAFFQQFKKIAYV